MARRFTVRKSGVKKLAGLLALSSLGGAAAVAQPRDTPTSPQTARQALVEMFFGKTSGTFAKHLPAATLSAVEKAGALETLQQYSLLASQLQAKGKTLETFDTGSTLLVAEDVQSSQKFEILVDSDSLRGDEDNIEVSFQTYKDKQPQPTPFLPRMAFGMKMESGVWKLNDIQITVRLPLADPEFLKGLTQTMQARAQAASAAAIQSHSQPATAGLGSDAGVLAAMQSIIKAENIYSSTYGMIGYTCTLSDLDGFGGGEPNPHQAMLIPSGLASGKKYGYVFTLSACTGTPATTFRVVAVPSVNGLGRRALCSDQSGAIRYSADGNSATCIASGSPAQ